MCGKSFLLLVYLAFSIFVLLRLYLFIFTCGGLVGKRELQDS
jgi:hypothetical protein